jgi:hypothetical protein
VNCETQSLNKENIMSHRQNWKMLVGAVLVAMLVGCASVPPGELVERNDHAGLAAWYKQQASHNRAHAEEMRQMAKEYETRMTKPSQKSDLVEHCRRLAEKYTRAAEEAETLAKMHAEQQIGQ